jgi:hypothetical protein
LHLGNLIIVRQTDNSFSQKVSEKNGGFRWWRAVSDSASQVRISFRIENAQNKTKRQFWSRRRKSKKAAFPQYCQYKFFTTSPAKCFLIAVCPIFFFFFFCKIPSSTAAVQAAAIEAATTVKGGDFSLCGS